MRIRLATVRALVFLGIVAFAAGETHPDIVEHFKYGSIGAEERAGIPYWIWLALPRAFPDLLPAKPGSGYERFRFVYEAGRRRPIGVSLLETTVPMVGLNCAACHTGTLRDRRTVRGGLCPGCQVRVDWSGGARGDSLLDLAGAASGVSGPAAGKAGQRV